MISRTSKRIAMSLLSTVAATAVLLPTAAQAVEAPQARNTASAQVAPRTDKPVTVTNGQSTQAGAPQVQAIAPVVSVAVAVIGIAEKIYKITVDAIATNQNRGGYVKSLMEGGFYEAGQTHNVMVINNDLKYEGSLHNLKSDVTVKSDKYGSYRILIFDSGTFTNHGDGGWINWAFRGWFTRDGGTVHFTKP